MLKNYTGTDGDAAMLSALVGETVVGVYHSAGNVTVVFQSGDAIRFGSSSSFWRAPDWRAEIERATAAVHEQLRAMVQTNTFLADLVAPTVLAIPEHQQT